MWQLCAAAIKQAPKLLPGQTTLDDKIRARVEKHSSGGKKLKQTQANPKKRARTPEPDSDAGVCEWQSCWSHVHCQAPEIACISGCAQASLLPVTFVQHGDPVAAHRVVHTFMLGPRY